MADHLTVAGPKAAPPVPAYGVPERDGDDYATLAAWYSGFAFCEQFRKVVLSQAKEALRGAMALQDIKVTESRLDDLAHTHQSYLAYLTVHLQGRMRWEEEYLAQGGFR